MCSPVLFSGMKETPSKDQEHGQKGTVKEISNDSCYRALKAPPNSLNTPTLPATDHHAPALQIGQTQQKSAEIQGGRESKKPKEK